MTPLGEDRTEEVADAVETELPEDALNGVTGGAASPPENKLMMAG
jgi:hypothetical protein